ncbi:MAG TPA: cytochrome P450 [Acidimicrobiales bacterium]|nr:cytochrome P450 [Acidimicrobiales bacterium]
MATPVDELDLVLLATSTSPDPEHDVAALARQGDVGWLAKFTFGYVVLGYSDVLALLRERSLHQASGLVAQLFTGEGTALDQLSRESLLSAEGATHTRLRRLVASPFSPKSIDRLRPFMRHYVNDLALGLANDEPTSFVLDAPVVLARYPIAVICHHLAVEQADWDLFSRWAETTFLLFSSEAQGNEDRIFNEMKEFSHYCTALIDERRRRLGDDLISHLIEAEQEGDRLSTPEMVSLIQGIIAAGTDTTRNQLSTTLALLSTRPELWDEMKGDDELVAGVVEESLRYLNPIRFVIRQVHEPFEYRDVAFAKGTLLAFSLAGANRDAHHFLQADTFDPRRLDARDHLTFSSGIHHCLGAALARAELHEALVALRDRWSTIEPAGEVVWKDSRLAVWGAQSVPLRVTTA